MRLLLKGLTYAGGTIGVVLLLAAWIALTYLAVNYFGFNSCSGPGPTAC